MTKWLSLVLNFAPLVLMTIPGMPVVLIPTIVHAIQEAQQIKGATGADKKAHVMAVVQDGIDAVNSAKGKAVINPALVTGAVSQGIDAAIGVVNLVQQAHAVK